MPPAEPVTLWFQPRCSKARGARDLLAERNVETEIRPYLDEPPTVAELEDLLTKLGTDDPRSLVRTKEPVYRELGLADADRDDLLAAIVAHPILLERPIVVRGGRAVIARPPERLLELF
jgi:arsenate reductase